MLVSGADEVDRSLYELDRARGGTDLAGEVGCPSTELREVKSRELGRVRDGGPERERPLEVGVGLGKAEDGLCLARRLDRRGERLRAAARRRPVRRKLGWRRGVASRELVGEARMELLALAGQDGRIDRLRQERMTKPEAAGPLLRDEDTLLDGPAQRLSHVSLGERRQRPEQRVANVPTGGRGQPQEVLRPAVEAGHSLEQEVAQAAWQLDAPIIGGGQELFREEGVALGAGDDRARQGRLQGRVGAGCEQLHHLVVIERAEFEHERRARASDAVRKPAQALRRGELVRAKGREQQNPQVDEVVREEDEEIERRRVGPVQILEHEHHRCGGRPVGEAGEGVLEDSQLRARSLPIARPRLSERTQCLDERLVGQFRADEIDRVPEEQLEPRDTSTPSQLGHETGLADTGFPGDQDGHTPSGARRIERALELPELGYASDEHLTGASHHSGQYRAAHRRWEGPMRIRTSEDT